MSRDSSENEDSEELLVLWMNPEVQSSREMNVACRGRRGESVFFFVFF